MSPTAISKRGWAALILWAKRLVQKSARRVFVKTAALLQLLSTRILEISAGAVLLTVGQTVAFCRLPGDPDFGSLLISLPLT